MWSPLTAPIQRAACAGSRRESEATGKPSSYGNGSGGDNSKWDPANPGPGSDSTGRLLFAISFCDTSLNR